jgi:hypothetical protein
VPCPQNARPLLALLATQLAPTFIKNSHIICLIEPRRPINTKYNVHLNPFLH